MKAHIPAVTDRIHPWGIRHLWSLPPLSDLEKTEQRGHNPLRAPRWVRRSSQALVPCSVWSEAVTSGRSLSECTMPLPATMRLMSPGSIGCRLPSESRCRISPSNRLARTIRTLSQAATNRGRCPAISSRWTWPVPQHPPQMSMCG